MVFCLGFCFMFWRFAPETVWKNSLDVRSCVFGFVLSSLGFSSTLFFSVFKRDRSGSNRTPPHALVWSFSLFVLPRLVFCRAPFWPCVLLLESRRFLGNSGPRAFLGFSWNLRGLSSLAPSEAPFLDARRHGCFWASCAWFLFFPFCFAATRFLEKPE